jgi:hypothetical protein
MAVLLLVGAILWVNVDASRELGGEPHKTQPALAAGFMVG